MSYSSLKPSELIKQEYTTEKWRENLEVYKEIVKDFEITIDEELNLDKLNHYLLRETNNVYGCYTLQEVSNICITVVGLCMEYLKQNYYFDVPYEYIFDKLFKVYMKKNWDYKNSAEKMLKLQGKYSLENRFTDKVSRINSYAKKGEYKVEDEDLVETVSDLANYCLIFLVFYKKQEG